MITPADVRKLKEQRDLLLGAAKEAVENCEVCRHYGSHYVSRCARCQTFQELIDKAEKS